MLQYRKFTVAALFFFFLGVASTAGFFYSKSAGAAIVSADAAQIGKVVDKEGGVACYYYSAGISCVKM